MGNALALRVNAEVERAGPHRSGPFRCARAGPGGPGATSDKTGDAARPRRLRRIRCPARGNYRILLSGERAVRFAPSKRAAAVGGEAAYGPHLRADAGLRR